MSNRELTLRGVVLGALLEATELVEQEQATSALRKLVKSSKWFEIDMQALERGRREMRKTTVPVSDDYLWGV